MTKQEKIEIVQNLVKEFQAHPSFIIANTGGLTVSKVNELRRKCFEAKLKIKVVKNTLIRKALEQIGGDYSKIFGSLKENSTIIFANENAAEPAKVLLDFKKDADIPKFKVAYVEAAVYEGEHQLEAVSKIKSKQELLGEVIGLLQSPIANVLNALQSSGGTLHGILKTLEERK